MFLVYFSSLTVFETNSISFAKEELNIDWNTSIDSGISRLHVSFFGSPTVNAFSFSETTISISGKSNDVEFFKKRFITIRCLVMQICLCAIVVVGCNNELPGMQVFINKKLGLNKMESNEV